MSIGYSAGGLADVVVHGIEFYQELAREFENEDKPTMPVSGVVGPRGDVWGGCCGTDYQHIAEIARAVLAVQ